MRSRSLDTAGRLEIGLYDRGSAASESGFFRCNERRLERWQYGACWQRTPVRVGADHVLPSTKVRDLGIFIDSDVTMQSHVTRTISGCFAVLRQLRSIRRSVPDSVFQTLVVALVKPRLDYGNATLAGLPAFQQHRLLSVLNAAARLIYRSPR